MHTDEASDNACNDAYDDRCGDEWEDDVLLDGSNQEERGGAEKVGECK